MFFGSKNARSISGGVVITGASSGIGRACALHLDKLGFRVFAGVRKAEDAGTLKAEASPRLTTVWLDVTDGTSITEAAAVVATAVKDDGLSGLVNNAGIAVAGPLEFLPIDELRHQLEVNVVGTVAVTQAFLPLLRMRQGRVVNVGSISGRNSVPLLGAYCASKFALEALTDVLRLELWPWGLLVSIIEPGQVATPIWRKSLSTAERLVQDFPPRMLERYGPAIGTLRRIATKACKAATPPKQVAKAVAHALTSGKPKTRYVLGRGAKKQLLLTFFPDSIRDRIIAKRFWAEGKSCPRGLEPDGKPIGITCRVPYET